MSRHYAPASREARLRRKRVLTRLKVVASIGVVVAAASIFGVMEAAATPTDAGAPTQRSAGHFLLHVIHEQTRGDWVTAWQTLYPPHQQVAPLDVFVPCERATPFPAPLQGISVTGVQPALVAVPVSAVPVDGVAVRVRVALSWYGPRDPIVFDHVLHLVPANGHWTWLLSTTSYQAFSHGGCAA